MSALTPRAGRDDKAGHSFERFYTPDDRIANCPDRLTSLVEDQGTTVSFWLPAGDVDQ